MAKELGERDPELFGRHVQDVSMRSRKQDVARYTFKARF